ncbi:class I SAM-dependent methyltransferase [Marinomonas balearica]|uniref:Ribosomal RNA small subunit methyltransferase J n=1 Tax=Marinomonas balearica TaxID=491947 RepID=A0A4R6M6Z6_9GAMM|nr:class I SAM-dependent methyltransferase [Marinomonas balearica]TDO96370.1 16S rRNA (guanine1516-N2)-methyltransferase [Marinomonas balearica]
MPNTLCVGYESNLAQTTARDISNATHLPLIRLKSAFKFFSDYAYVLMVHETHIELAQTGKGAANPVMIDFVSGANDHRRKFGGGKGQDIAKAVGINKRKGLSVLDATAGLARDAFVLASLGCRIDMCERVPFVRELLKDGLTRAALNLDVSDIISRMALLEGQLFDQTKSYDVVYLDPMFPHMEKSAAAKKEMAFFRNLVGKDEDADLLLDAAYERCVYRTVVKRPKGAPHLNNLEPTYKLEGKAGRFDIYVKASLDSD